jgi:hypothetical protein
MIAQYKIYKPSYIGATEYYSAQHNIIYIYSLNYPTILTMERKDTSYS